MTTTPTRPMRPTLQVRDHLGAIHRLLADHGTEIAVSWSNVLDQLNDAGWPARTPEGDRRRSTPCRGDDTCTCPDCDPTDYSDPTPEAGFHLNRQHEVREMFEDHRHVIEKSLQAMIDLAKRHRPDTIDAIPQCTTRTCSNPVENSRDQRGKIRYRSMEFTSSGWQAKPGSNPVCRTCRDRGERAA